MTSYKKTIGRTTWKYDIKSEAVRLIHTAQFTYNGFYKTNNFIVVPYDVEGDVSSVVKLPDILFCEIPRFWKRVEQTNLHKLYKSHKGELVEEVAQALEKVELEVPAISDIQKQWGDVEELFLEAIYELLPSKKGKVKKITIYPTSFGTSTSFNLVKESDSELIIFLRHDQDIYKIAEAILTALTRNDVQEKYEGLWRDSEIIVDWLVGETKINSILKKVVKKRKSKPTIANLTDKQMGKYMRISREYMKLIGVSFNNHDFEIINDDIYYCNKPIINLSVTESQVLKELITNSNRTVRFNDISELMGYNPASYSLYAITKLIQRLRNKLERSGITSGVIKTVRGEGYILNN